MPLCKPWLTVSSCLRNVKRLAEVLHIELRAGDALGRKQGDKAIPCPRQRWIAERFDLAGHLHASPLGLGQRGRDLALEPGDLTRFIEHQVGLERLSQL